MVPPHTQSAYAESFMSEKWASYILILAYYDYVLRVCVCVYCARINDVQRAMETAADQRAEQIIQRPCNTHKSRNLCV